MRTLIDARLHSEISAIRYFTVRPSMFADTMDPEIGRLITRYKEKGVLISESELEIQCQLGEGASGVAYKAIYGGELVAFKVYANSVLYQDFVSCCNEMDIMTSIRHENVIPYRGIVLQEFPMRVGLVMELAGKGELGDALYKSKTLKKQRIGTLAKFKIALGIANGLKYLHEEKKVMHRDIKPANVLLGNNYEALLTDFGLSRYVDSESAGPYTAETGSYRYMAPEVIRHEKYSFKADVYSWAVVANELFSGERPFANQMPVDAARCVVNEHMRPSQKKISARSSKLRDIIALAWDADPEKRPDWDVIISEITAVRGEYIAAKSSGMSGLLRRSNKFSSGEAR